MSAAITTARYEVSPWGIAGAEQDRYVIWDNEINGFCTKASGDVSIMSKSKAEAMAARREAKDNS